MAPNHSPCLLADGWEAGRGVYVPTAACPGAGIKGKQVAKRGQQKPGQPLAHAREGQQSQAGVWTMAGIRRGRQREGRTDKVGEKAETQRWGWRYMRRETETLRW